MITKNIFKLSTNISSGITPLRSNIEFWINGTIRWLKTEQLGEKYIYNTNEKITELALEKTSIKINPENTLSVAMYGEGKTRGSVSILKNSMATNQACCNIVLDPKQADHEYVYYFLKTQYNALRNLSSGVRKNLNSNDIKRFDIRLPEEVTLQKKIATVLSALDAKIELNNRINIELEAMAKTLYDYWFVQFDFPISKEQAKAMGKLELTGKPYKSSGGKMVYNETLKREIPVGWEVKPVSTCCNIVDCLHSKKPTYKFEDEIFYLLQLENIGNDGLINISNKFYVSKKDYEIWTSRIEIKGGDIVITNAGRVAANAQIPYQIVAGIGRNITAIRPFAILPHYLFMSLNGFDIQQQISWNTDHGAFFKSFNVRGIKLLNILRPPKYLEKSFESITDPIRRKRDCVLEQNQQLAQLRDWLLPMLMNGQVTVK